MSLTKLSQAERVWLVTSRLWTGKPPTFFSVLKKNPFTVLSIKWVASLFQRKLSSSFVTKTEPDNDNLGGGGMGSSVSSFIVKGFILYLNQCCGTGTGTGTVGTVTF
jgi:hypothetical protein